MNLSGITKLTDDVLGTLHRKRAIYECRVRKLSASSAETWNEVSDIFGLVNS